MFEKYYNKTLILLASDSPPKGAMVGFILCTPFIILSKILQIPVFIISIIIGWYYIDEEK